MVVLYITEAQLCSYCILEYEYSFILIIYFNIQSMKRIYTIILLFVLAFSQIYAQSGPTNGLKKISVTVPAVVRTATKSAVYSEKTKLSFISATTKSSALITNDTITEIGFFKDRDCVGSVTLPLVRSCGIGCATGTGSMAGCWKSGLGIFIYDASQSGAITKDSARSDAHFLLFDAQSKELTRAFVESLPSAASGKISIKVSGYRVANGIPSNKNETVIPELTTDSIDHYLNAFHLLSIEGVHINGLTYSYTKFDTISCKLTQAALAPKNILAVNYSGGTTLKFTPPANKTSAKSTLKGYKARVFNQAGVLQDSYTKLVNDSSVTSINIAGLTASQNYSYTVSALYPGSGVEVKSDPSSGTETQIGWFKDRDCLYDSIALPLTSSCGIDCGTSCGVMASCWNSGLGVFIYDANQSGTISVDSSRTDTHYLLFDPQSKELTRAFLESLPDDADGKILVKVTGYRVANGISADKSELYVPEINADSVVHYLNAFHLLSIEGVVVDTLGYPGFATKSYKLTPEDLAPTNVSAVNYTGETTFKFTPPANEAFATTTLTGYKVQVYNKAGVVQDTYTTTVNDSSVTSVQVPGFTATQDYTFTVSALYPGSAVAVESAQSNLIDSSSGLKNTTTSSISVYPTLSQGEITVISPADATIKVLDYTGKTIESYQSSGSRTISLNIQSGLYLINVESAGETSVQKVIIRK